ncbi:MAG: hypothetical protein E6J34_18615 [Chloroflexi bacterium]|nr:MAG: hypothetical protein E6J34_18615 [Chloroflexota bacterium]
MRITHAAPHLSVEEVSHRMKNDPRGCARQRWLIIYNALADPREASSITKHTGASVRTVHKTVSMYNKFGVAAVETPGRGGRRWAYLTVEKERYFLQPFFERAANGEIATTAQIQQAFEKKVGQKVDDSTIYRLLDRHEWRKKVPHPFHPQADKKEQELVLAKFSKDGRLDV